MTDDINSDSKKSARVLLKGPALTAALAIQKELELSNLSDAISVYVDRCNKGQSPVVSSSDDGVSDKPPKAMEF